MIEIMYIFLILGLFFYSLSMFNLKDASSNKSSDKEKQISHLRFIGFGLCAIICFITCAMVV